MRAQRRNAIDTEERKKVSKQIWRKTRDQLRFFRTKQATEKLTEFSRLEYLQKLRMYPVTKTHTIGPNLESCSQFLQQVFTSDHHMEYDTNYSVPPFSFYELECALRGMQKGRCCDKDGLFLEMFLYSGDDNMHILCSTIRRHLRRVVRVECPTNPLSNHQLLTWTSSLGR